MNLDGAQTRALWVLASPPPLVAPASLPPSSGSSGSVLCLFCLIYVAVWFVSCSSRLPVVSNSWVCSPVARHYCTLIFLPIDSLSEWPSFLRGSIFDCDSDSLLNSGRSSKALWYYCVGDFVSLFLSHDCLRSWGKVVCFGFCMCRKHCISRFLSP